VGATTDGHGIADWLYIRHLTRIDVFLLISRIVLSGKKM
jgi:hypothetical protein